MNNMNNSTLKRKPSNDMVKNAGLYPVRSPVKQGRDVESMAFNGQMGDGVNRNASSHRHAGNQSGLVARENYDNGPRRASENSQASRHEHGKPVTKDKYRTAPATAAGGASLGTRAWEPNATQNYRGNPDKINVGMK